MPSYGMTFTPATLARLSRLMATAPIFAKYYATAMAYSVNLVRQRAVANAPVGTRPTGGIRGGVGGGHGTLRRGITAQVVSPWLGVVGVGTEVPYARRREFGFTGMTDALGRYYANDPGSFYLRNALQASEPEIAAAFHSAAQMGWREVAR